MIMQSVLWEENPQPACASVCMVLSYRDTIMAMAYIYLNKQNMGMV